MDRKKFIQLATAAAVTGSLLTIINACKKTASGPTVDFTIDLAAATNAALKNSGGTLVQNNIIIINNAGTYVAVSDLCTHQGCAVNFSNSKKHLVCPCHGAEFGLDGSVVKGPASTPLQLYTTTLTGNSLRVYG
jgi:cytochrome b6-f complex iron-sulfur subunit